jgi:hypothetical protein
MYKKNRDEATLILLSKFEFKTSPFNSIDPVKPVHSNHEVS